MASLRGAVSMRGRTVQRHVVARSSARFIPIEVKPAASYSPFLSPQGYAESYEPVFQRVFASADTPRVGMVLVFDIDDTLNVSSGTGNPGQIPDDVLDAVKRMQGAGNQFFVMAATGRSPQDAQKAFGDFAIPLVANDGSWIRFPDGTVLEHPYPNVPEFDFLADAIMSKDVISVRNLNLPVGVGLSFPRNLPDLHAYTYYKELFEYLVASRSDELVLYPHSYNDSVELVVQNAKCTKATGILTIVAWLMKVYGLEEVYVFAHGNSSNDKAMIELANQMKQQQLFGGSFWVGGINKDATCSFKEVRDLQLGLIILAGMVEDALAGEAV